MPLVALYDACVLYPAPVRDLLLRIAQSGFVQAKWTERILDECFNNILKNRPDLNPDNLIRTRQEMNIAIADCIITNYEDSMDGLSLPDPGDLHVLAAAIKAEASLIITANLKHFLKYELSKYNIEAKHPDVFISELVDIAPDKLCNIIIEQCAALKNPPYTEKNYSIGFINRD